jgi:arylsulfatase A-like enzyme
MSSMERERAPNFVVIMTDTQKTNVLGAYGHLEMHTPRIDRPAAKQPRPLTFFVASCT